MAKGATETTTQENQCPKCQFNGSDLTNDDGSLKFPQGFGIETIQPVENGKTVTYQRRRCPKCGHASELKKIEVPA